jgi:MFS family permease
MVLAYQHLFLSHEPSVRLLPQVPHGLLPRTRKFIQARPVCKLYHSHCFRLTQGAFILPGGRLGAIYGHKKVLVFGAVIWMACTLASGFAPNLITLCILRALTGIGGGIMVPNCIALLGITFPPGRWRNVGMGLFGAATPVGGGGGGIIAGLLVQFTPWKWMFFFL